jgi:hypothetical protein
MNEKECIEYLKSKGYAIVEPGEMSETEKCIQNIMNIYDGLGKEGKKKLVRYVMMISYIGDHEAQFTSYCLRKGFFVENYD